MLEEFRRNITENSLPDTSGKLLLAVSGGIDSMVMAHLFLRCRSDIGIAHCNFRLRGAESDGDEAFVRRFAIKHDIPFHFIRFDTTGYAGEKGISIQMAARELRYRWFEEIRLQHGYDFIVLAHNMNDNIETFLINLTRGTGIAGLTGMKPRFNRIIRPLLFATRNAIENYSREFKVKFREDRSNSDTKYTRNKIRHSIVPLFREINPSFDSTITETAERLGEVNEIFAGFISGIREKAIFTRDGITHVKLNHLKGITPKRTILYELLRPFGIGPRQLEELMELSEGKTGSQLITDKTRLIKNRNEILITPLESSSGIVYEAATLKELRQFPFIRSASVRKRGDGFSIPSSTAVACLDYDKIEFPLKIRSWIHGDYFQPLGMKSKKKLSDFFVDQKYSLPEKEKQLILESAGRIAWVMGIRIDDRFKVTLKTGKTLVIRLKQG
jgi:tRNA(Ile)-lysidine synthase